MSPVSNLSKPAGMKLTYDDFVLFPDDGKRTASASRGRWSWRAKRATS